MNNESSQVSDAQVLAVRARVVSPPTGTAEILPEVQEPVLEQAATGWNPTQKPEWVYIARSECGQYVKVGITTVPQSKLKAIATAAIEIMGPDAPNRWHYLALFCGGLDVERAVLSHFSPYRSAHGDEWFECCDVILDFAWKCASWGRCALWPKQTPHAGPGRPRRPATGGKETK